jgi:CRP-like cAMP-binding protein
MTNHDMASIDSLDLFAGCSRHEQALIAQLATVVDVDRGVVLCAEGEVGQTFYAISDGEVIVSIDAQAVATLGPGCGFGEIALLRPGGRRIATVTTSTPARLILFSRPEFATLMSEVPRVAHALVAESRCRLEATADRHGPFATS